MYIHTPYGVTNYFGRNKEGIPLPLCKRSINILILLTTLLSSLAVDVFNFLFSVWKGRGLCISVYIGIVVDPNLSVDNFNFLFHCIATVFLLRIQTKLV